MKCIILFGLVAALFTGCATTPQPAITTPSSTPFDSNLMQREAYLDGYRTGYRAVMAGEQLVVDTIAGPHREARRAGFLAGAGQARYEASRK